jgi:hypothetical protein
MGYEYELHRYSPYRDRPKLPDCFMVQWEGLHYEYGDQADGYEIKSPIAPLHYHKYLIRKHFGSIKWNTDPTNWGGIHVNVSSNIPNGRKRRDLIAEFARKYSSEMQLLSGRSENSFYKYANPTHDATNYYNFLSTRKSQCFELRMFHAQPHLLLPALEFTDSMFELAAQAGAIEMDSWIKFINRWSRYQHIAAHVRSTLCKKSTLLPTVMASMDSKSLVSSQIAA